MITEEENPTRRERPVGGAYVTAVSRSAGHTFSKGCEPVIRLLAGLGVEGDAHLGVTVRHRSRVARDPSQPNLRQVHLIHAELHEELRAAGFSVGPGELGENVTTRGVDLLGLPAGALLRLGGEAVVRVTGLRNPCAQIEAFRSGLLARVVGRDEEGRVVRRAGVMGVVVAGGAVRAGDRVEVELPPPPYRALERV
ncbi:MOSC domain-containing protein [Streptosporangium nondiastaticum]|uniref:MOSC domain-containing protein n=1 Tax=Streptosporangium nondiastaticum TaxID=35764 RepID=UPI0031FA2BDC